MVTYDERATISWEAVFEAGGYCSVSYHGRGTGIPERSQPGSFI